jgi:hypothetical protein
LSINESSSCCNIYYYILYPERIFQSEQLAYLQNAQVNIPNRSIGFPGGDAKGT